MTTSLKKTVKVFIKNPRKEEVKTRLAASIGDDEALKVYYSLLKYTRDVVSRLIAQKEVWYSDAIVKHDDWSSDTFIKKLQKGSDLGTRMRYAFKDSFNQEPYQSVILIGSDCAELNPKIVNQAFHELEKYDLVLGPAYDGGYYLIGMSGYIPGIFQNVNWSTAQVLEQTLSNAKKQKASVFLLQTLNDVDKLEDWLKVKNKLMTDG